MSDVETISQAQAKHTPLLMGKANVVGVGRGYKVVKGRKTDKMCVVVLVRHKVPSMALEAHALVPRAIDGVETDVIEVGELVAQVSRTERLRPAPPGVSLGHYQITAGTFGAVVRDKATGDSLDPIQQPRLGQQQRCKDR